MTAHLADPWLLGGLLLPLALLWLRQVRGGAASTALVVAPHLPGAWQPWLWRAAVAASLALAVLAWARPQSGQHVSQRTQRGRDLMLVIDTSRSMSVDDLVAPDGERSDRLAAVFAAAQAFIQRRPDDRIGVVCFATRAATCCPLTFDHDTLSDLLDRTQALQRWRWSHLDGQAAEVGLFGDGTNIGLALGDALRSLDDPQAEGRALILITDGADSRDMPGWIDPLLAAAHARALATTIYGIGVGDPQGSITDHLEDGESRVVPTPPSLLPDMERLAAITAAAGGSAFRANDQTALARVLDRIDRLEPAPHPARDATAWEDRWSLLLALALTLGGAAFALEPLLRGAP